MENPEYYNSKNKYEKSFNVYSMHDYKYFMLNVLARYEEQVRDTQRALREGLDLEKSEKYKGIVEQIKIQRGYERTIKMVGV